MERGRMRIISKLLDYTKTFLHRIFSENLLGEDRKRRFTAFISNLLIQIYDALPADGKYKFYKAVCGGAQKDRSLCADVNPFPDRLKQFETLYHQFTGDWFAPLPQVRIESFDKTLYPETVADSVELETGHFYFNFVRLIDARLILETGVSRGYSTSCLAAGLRAIGSEGQVYAIDPALYPHLWEGTELEQFITWIPKFSFDCLEELQNHEFDLLIIDSLHDYETCLWEVSHFEPLLKPGGYMLMHDSLHYDGVGAVVKQLSRNPRFELVTLPTPRGRATFHIWPRYSGLTVVRKIRNGLPMIEYEAEFKEWFWGDTTKPPYLWRTE